MIFDGDLDRSITDADCKRMLYLDSCIRETLRLMPPVSFITRKAGSDIHLGNHKYADYCFFLEMFRIIYDIFIMQIITDASQRVPKLFYQSILSIVSRKHSNRWIFSIIQVLLLGNPEVYPQPNTFCPDRWKNEISQGHFIPWSSGPRACLGNWIFYILSL